MRQGSSRTPGVQYVHLLTPMLLTRCDAGATLHNMHDKLTRRSTPATALALFREYQILRAEVASRAAASASSSRKENGMAKIAQVQA